MIRRLAIHIRHAVTLIAVLFAIALHSPAQITWERIPGTSQPPYFNQWHNLTYNDAENVTLAWVTDTAGGAASIYSDSLWKFDSTLNKMTLISTNNQPSAGPCVRNSATWPGSRHPAGQMWWDSKRKALLQVEGVCGANDNIDMWQLNSGIWAQMNPAHYPSPAHNLSRVIHNIDDDVYFLWGNDKAGTPALDWIYCPTDLNSTPGALTPAQTLSGCTVPDDWTRIYPVGGRAAESTAQWMPGMIYEPWSHKIIKFGGQAPNGSADATSNHTWTFNLRTLTWSDITSGTLPPQPTGYKGYGAGQWHGQPPIALNTNDHQIYYHDNLTPSDWVYDPVANRWNQLCQCGGPTAISTMAYDPIANALIAWVYTGPSGVYQLWKGQLNGNTQQPSSPIITTLPALPPATLGVPYSQMLAASGSIPITWCAETALPAGLSISTDGVVSGTPTSFGTSTFSVRASNGTAPDSIQQFTLVVQSCFAKVHRQLTEN